MPLPPSFSPCPALLPAWPRSSCRVLSFSGVAASWLICRNRQCGCAPRPPAQQLSPPHPSSTLHKQSALLLCQRRPFPRACFAPQHCHFDLSPPICPFHQTCLPPLNIVSTNRTGAQCTCPLRRRPYAATRSALPSIVFSCRPIHCLPVNLYRRASQGPGGGDIGKWAHCRKWAEGFSCRRQLRRRQLSSCPRRNRWRRAGSGAIDALCVAPALFWDFAFAMSEPSRMPRSAWPQAGSPVPLTLGQRRIQPFHEMSLQRRTQWALALVGSGRAALAALAR